MRRCQNSRSRGNAAPGALVGAASAASFSARRRGRSPDPRPADATHRSVHTLAAGLLREPPLPARGRPTGFFVLLPPLRRQGRAGEGLRQRRRLPEGSVRAVTTPSQPPPAFAGGGAKARNNAMDFSRFFIDRPIFAAVLSIVIFAAGLISIPLLPIGEYPAAVPPSVVVRTVYHGANPTVIAETVAPPLAERKGVV